MASALCLTSENIGLALAYQMAMEGNFVKVQDSLPVPQVMQSKHISYIKNALGMIEQFDLIFCFSKELGDLADACEEQGKPVVGGGSYVASLMDEGDVNFKFQEVLFHESFNPDKEPDFVIEQWYHKGKWYLPRAHFIERRLMEQDRGPDIGCALIGSVPGKAPWINFPEPVEKAVEKFNYFGPVYIGYDIKNGLAIPCKVYLGFLYDHMYTLTESVYGMFNTIWNIHTGNTPDIRPEFTLGIRFTTLEGVFDIDLEEGAKRHVHFHDRKKGCITARGSSFHECSRRIYRTFKRLELPKTVMYRNDGSTAFNDRYERLKDLGWEI